MKEPVELEHLRKTDEIRRFSNKELRITKELMRTSEYRGSIRKKSHNFFSGIVGTAYNSFINEDCLIATSIMNKQYC